MNPTDPIASALEEIAGMTFDPWTNGAKAGEIARAALASRSPAQAPDDDLHPRTRAIATAREFGADLSEKTLWALQVTHARAALAHRAPEQPVHLTEPSVERPEAADAGSGSSESVAWLYRFRTPDRQLCYASLDEHERRDGITDEEWMSREMWPLSLPAGSSGSGSD